MRITVTANGKAFYGDKQHLFSIANVRYLPRLNAARQLVQNFVVVVV